MKTAIPVRLLSLACLLAAGGCNLIGAIAYKASGPESVEAKFSPGERSTLVMADAARDSKVEGVDADTLARYVDGQLKPKLTSGKPPTPMISADRALDARSREPAFAQKSIAAVGRELGADQVIYIEMHELGSERYTGSDSIRAWASASVRVVDAATGATLWPAQSAVGLSVSYETPVTRLKPGVDATHMRTAAMRGLADSIAKCFYKWQPDVDLAPKVVAD